MGHFPVSLMIGKRLSKTQIVVVRISQVSSWWPIPRFFVSLSLSLSFFPVLRFKTSSYISFSIRKIIRYYLFNIDYHWSPFSALKQNKNILNILISAHSNWYQRTLNSQIYWQLSFYQNNDSLLLFSQPFRYQHILGKNLTLSTAPDLQLHTCKNQGHYSVTEVLESKKFWEHRIKEASWKKDPKEGFSLAKIKNCFSTIKGPENTFQIWINGTYFAHQKSINKQVTTVAIWIHVPAGLERTERGVCYS